ncbi:MAG TPA: IS256 family transposase [Streptosporangiaceae bacterium]
MSNTYQKKSRRAQPDPAAEVAVPEQVIVSMAEIAESAKEGLLALAAGTGLQVMAAMFAEDTERLCGPDGKHNRERAGYRHGAGAGPVTLGGRRLPVTRPRVRAADGSGELHLPSYGLFSSTEILGQLALEKMLAGLSSRRYVRGLEPAGQAAGDAAVPVSKPAVSRRFAAATETALAELMSKRLDDLDLVAFMVDGVHFGEHTCVVALGIGIDGTRHPLAVEEGSTENATLVTDLITGLRDRGLDVTRPVLAILDGAKALSRAVKDVFGKPLIHRCQEHKIRNVKDKLPGKLRAVTERRMRQAYHAESALKAEGLLTELAAELGKTHPGAAASLREGMAETLTILRLGVPPTLARTLRSTNTIESMIGICREHSKNVKRWRDGTMALRWCAAGMAEAGHQFRRVNGHLHLPKLRAALDAHFRNVTTVSQNEDQKAA